MMLKIMLAFVSLQGVQVEAIAAIRMADSGATAGKKKSSPNS